MTPEVIEAIAAENEEAALRLACVMDVMRRLVGKALRDDESGGAGSVEDLIAEAAPEAMAAVLAKPTAAGCSPPWPPPRYKLPDDRTGVNGSLRMGGGDLLNLTCWVNFYPDNTPAEIFVEKGGDQSIVAALLDALSVAISIGLQYGIPFEVFADKLLHWTFPPSGITDDKDSDLRLAASPLDYLFKWTNKQISKRGKTS